jgi:uncharacterized protein with NAD-binding domain and iron-sulfur cluster
MKKKIAILGGGMAGLAAAYELTRTEELRAMHEVTIYQMGWRLGGKAASSRDEFGRNIEHGLHVWFGSYENVFSLVQDVYEHYRLPYDCPIRTWRDVAKPRSYSPIGVETKEGWKYLDVIWPENGDTPGVGPAHMSVRAAWQSVWNLVSQTIQGFFSDELNISLPPQVASLLFDRRQVSESQGELLTMLTSRNPEAFNTLENLIEGYSIWHKLLPDSLTQFGEKWLWSKIEATNDLIAEIVKMKFDFDLDHGDEKNLRRRVLHELLVIFLTAHKGYLKDILLPNKPFESIDHLDLREWLIGHGADRALVESTSVLRALYDTMYQFKDGDATKPSYAAGTAIGVVARLIGTFKGAVLWDLQAGMGDAVIAPIYSVLKARGVNVKFFHKVSALELSQDRKTVQRIRLKEQAEPIQHPYVPVKEIRNLRCWSTEPDWAQLIDGQKLRADQVNFESHWDQTYVRELTLEAGADFDQAVLAISLGAYKPLNSDPGMCDQLIQANPRFSDFVKKMEIVPTLSLQLWSNRSLKDLGWNRAAPACVSGPEYLNIWADMTQVKRTEISHREFSVKSLHYLTGTFATKLYRAPLSAKDTPKQAKSELRALIVDWLNTHGHVAWPLTGEPGNFDFSVLSSQTGALGESRLDEQYYRANIDPTECCVRSGAGMTQYRLGPGESGFGNLVLAGEATRHGFNTTSLEGAVMSGMAASRHICGYPAQIDGYDFLSRKPLSLADGVPIVDTAAYSSWTGHGGLSLAPPAMFTNATAFLFTISANRHALQSMVDKFLNSIAPASVQYSVVADYVGLSFTDIERCTSKAENIGWLPGREAAFWIPLRESRGNPKSQRFVLWSPYIFIDYAIGMVSGREIWGWPKALAEIGFPGNEQKENYSFHCQTTVFKTFNPANQGETQKVIEVLGTNKTSLFDGIWNFVENNFASKLVNSLFNTVSDGMGEFDLLRPKIPTIVARQLRDAENPAKAILSQVIDSPVKINNLRSARVLNPKDFKVRIKNYESHQIAKDLFGLTLSGEDLELPVSLAFQASLDFEALPGQIVN